MSRNESPTPAINTESRKRIVVLAGMGLLLVMVIAFVMGNPFRGDKEDFSKDEPIQTIWPESTPEDDKSNWLNQPTLPVLADTTTPAQQTPEIPAGTQLQPPPINAGEAPTQQLPSPTNGSVVAQNSPNTSEGSAAATTQVTDPSQATKPQPGAMTQTQPPTSDPVVAAATNNGAATSTPVLPQADPNRPSGMSSDSGASTGTAANAPDAIGNKPAAAVPAPATSDPASKPQLAQTTPAATPAVAPQAASSAAAQKTSSPAVVPDFVAPPKRRGKIIAQTKNLITQAEVRGKPTPTNSGTQATVPAEVPHEEARKFASQTTKTLKAKGLLKPGQTARLPRRSETANTKVWHEDDQPTSAAERRPFGIVIAEDQPAAPEQNPAFTAEGIPLRTDIPAGTSPLEKTGPDKPLWKRPE